MASIRRASLLAAALLLAAQAGGAAPHDGAAAARQSLLRELNEERERSGSPPFRLVERLTEAAQEHAEELSRRGSVRLGRGSEDRIAELFRQVGYEAHAWAEGVVATGASPGGLVSEWRRESWDLYQRVMKDEYLDVGIGVSRLGSQALYTLLFAVPRGEHFSRTTAGLADLEAVRAAVLERVNRARRQGGLAPLKPNERLDRAAQRHAQDMFERAYFQHESPEGATMRDRIEATGYRARIVGENLAFGQTSAEEVVDGWLKSPGHRRNILENKFREMGLGIALGRDGKGRYRVVWVQSFGARY